MTTNDNAVPDDLVPADVLASTSPVAIFSLAELKPGKDADELRKALASMISATREEKGHVQYTVHTNLHQPGVYAFYECWSTGADLAQHMRNPALQPYHAALFENLEMTTLEWLRPFDA